MKEISKCPIQEDKTAVKNQMEGDHGLGATWYIHQNQLGLYLVDQNSWA